LRASRATLPLAALAAVLAGALPFAAGTTAWPEIVTPAWFVTQGYRLYDAIYFPHTPLLILLTAAGGALFGFSAAVLRAIPALALAATAALLVLGARPHGSSRRGPLAGLLLGVPLLALLTVYAEGPALWPEPFLAPFLLAGVLLLERHERTRSPRALAAAGLVFGLAILVKQTSAWAALAALLWLVLRSRRRGLRVATLFAAATALPYAAFAATWALAFRTLAHIRWTLVYPVFSGMSRQIAVPLTGADVHEALVLVLPFAALALAAEVPRVRTVRSPLVAVALGAIGMAWPRPGLLHLAALAGLAALAAARTALVLSAAPRGLRRGRGSVRLLTFAGSVALLAVTCGVATLGAGPLLLDRLGGPLHYWDDAETRGEAAAVLLRVPAGGEFLVFGGRQTLYPIAQTRMPGGFYVNPSFWYCLNRDRGDERLVAALRARPGTLVLFREPTVDAEAIRRTALYAFVKAGTDAAGPAGEAEWRVVRRAPR
jgi:hypothetical protein